MSIFFLQKNDLTFPPGELAHDSGVLAIGGDLSVDRLIQAYGQGIFPWFDPHMEPMWWCPDPRCVIYPDRVRVTKSMRQLLRAKKFRVTYDQAFEQVIEGCETVFRPDQDGTWINEEYKTSFSELHRMGFTHSVEVWEEEELVGGLYGMAMGNVFFGESMFARRSNASKFGFIHLCHNLAERGFEFIDCQYHNDHLFSLGAEMVPRDYFLEVVRDNAIDHLEKGQDWNEIHHGAFDWNVQ
ncbi:leucyl/phenylalanyl-tRNA--protein transferase [Persicobacter sp. CCB-QB2]|uniref:leucyl/phenylalanyl-tRNA--protein transferase n=1 Tax=Persicobacter sp. CCB-QB2 TaxID=1561025 RepID=UPI0006A96FDC|nr:leucyl/phenylalanyl-tRNA--protein transferase [Persicobacter sp. CCB-QB2]